MSSVLTAKPKPITNFATRVDPDTGQIHIRVEAGGGEYAGDFVIDAAIFDMAASIIMFEHADG